MLFVAEKCIKGRICHAIHQYVKNVKTNNKYMKNYDKKRIFISLVLERK